MRYNRRHRQLLSHSPAFALLSGPYSFIFYFVLATILIMLSFSQQALVEKLRLQIADSLATPLTLVAMPLQGAAQALSDIGGFTALQAENARLQEENARLQEWFRAAQMLSAENQALRDLLYVEKDPMASYKTARILSDPGHTYVKSVLINAGHNSQIKEDQPVLSREGLIGRVVAVGDNLSRVLLITDINSRIPVILEESGLSAIAAGRNTQEMILELLPHTQTIKPGERVLTSGHGGVFPAGLPVGVVRTIDNDRTVHIDPLATFSKSLFVQIIDTGYSSLSTGSLQSSQSLETKKSPAP